MKSHQSNMLSAIFVPHCAFIFSSRTADVTSKMKNINDKKLIVVGRTSKVKAKTFPMSLFWESCAAVILALLSNTSCNPCKKPENKKLPTTDLSFRGTITEWERCWRRHSSLEVSLGPLVRVTNSFWNSNDVSRLAVSAGSLCEESLSEFDLVIAGVWQSRMGSA